MMDKIIITCPECGTQMRTDRPGPGGDYVIVRCLLCMREIDISDKRKISP